VTLKQALKPARHSQITPAYSLCDALSCDMSWYRRFRRQATLGRHMQWENRRCIQKYVGIDNNPSACSHPPSNHAAARCLCLTRCLFGCSNPPSPTANSYKACKVEREILIGVKGNVLSRGSRVAKMMCRLHPKTKPVPSRRSTVVYVLSQVENVNKCPSKCRPKPNAVAGPGKADMQ